MGASKASKWDPKTVLTTTAMSLLAQIRLGATPTLVLLLLERPHFPLARGPRWLTLSGPSRSCCPGRMRPAPQRPPKSCCRLDGPPQKAFFMCARPKICQGPNLRAVRPLFVPSDPFRVRSVRLLAVASCPSAPRSAGRGPARTTPPTTRPTPGTT